MNIAENLTRIIQGKKDIVDTIAETGCPIPLDIKIEDIPEYIDKLKYKKPEIYKYLTFKCEDPNGTATILLLHNSVENTKVFEYSLDDEETWNTFNEDEPYTINNGLKLMLRSTDNLPMATGAGMKFRHFTLSGDNIEVLGNVMSLMNFTDELTTNYALNALFENNKTIVRLSENLLSFKTIRGIYACSYLFNGCTGLTTLPEKLLPAKELDLYCYYCMFQGCTGLTTLPEKLLPATTLQQTCYSRMFYNCTNLENTPKLPALTLGTSSLAYTNRYNEMFYGCSKLNKVYCNALYAYGTTKITSSISSYWLSGVSSTGTFYKNKDLDISTITRGVNCIPTGWTVEDYE